LAYIEGNHFNTNTVFRTSARRVRIVI